MAIIVEIIRVEDDGTLSFGDYISVEKHKVNDYAVAGDVYKVKTHKEITRLEKNGNLLLEAVPGASIHHFQANEKEITFLAEGFEDTSLTLELEPGKEYSIYVDDMNVGSAKANLSGKVNFSAELGTEPQAIKLIKQ